MNKHNTSSKCSFSGGEFTACLLWCHIFQHDSLTLVKDHLSSRATTADNLRHSKATLMYVAGSRRALEIQPFCGKAVNLQPSFVCTRKLTNVSLCEMERAESKHVDVLLRLWLWSLWESIVFLRLLGPEVHTAQTFGHQKRSLNVGPESTAGKQGLQTVSPDQEGAGEAVTFMRL